MPTKKSTKAVGVSAAPPPELNGVFEKVKNRVSELRQVKFTRPADAFTVKEFAVHLGDLRKLDTASRMLKELEEIGELEKLKILVPKGDGTAQWVTAFRPVSEEQKNSTPATVSGAKRGKRNR